MHLCNARSLVVWQGVAPQCLSAPRLLLFFGFIATLFLLLCSPGLLPPNTTWSPATEWTRQREIDVFLAVQSDHETRHIDNLLSYTDMTLFDEDTSVVNRLGETEFVDTCLQAAFKEVFDFEGEHVIELHAGFVEHTNTDETANESIAFEQTLRIFFV
jgi:hypothetical protein